MMDFEERLARLRIRRQDSRLGLCELEEQVQNQEVEEDPNLDLSLLKADIELNGVNAMVANSIEERVPGLLSIEMPLYTFTNNLSAVNKEAVLTYLDKILRG